jgi:hypothetical protein
VWAHRSSIPLRDTRANPASAGSRRGTVHERLQALGFVRRGPGRTRGGWAPMRRAGKGRGARRGALAAALVLAAGCGGGGSSPSSPSYPSVMATYGSYAGASPGASQRRWVAPDGTSIREDCWAVTSIPTQNGAQFSGTVQRLDPCNDRATIFGTVALRRRPLADHRGAADREPHPPARDAGLGRPGGGCRAAAGRPALSASSGRRGAPRTRAGRPRRAGASS